MKRSYDRIAFFYDRLATLLFGQSLHRAQMYLLPLIPADAAILVVGGGTGKILEEISRLCPQHLHIDYVDSSAKMIDRATKRNTGNNEVCFIRESVITFAATKSYDIVITPFLLDNFSEATMQQVFDRLHRQLKPGGLWLYTDFQLSGIRPFWQQPLLRLMYFFFRTVCHIEADHLPDVVSQYRQYNYLWVKQKTFFRRFVLTAAYQKPFLTS